MKLWMITLLLVALAALPVAAHPAKDQAGDVVARVTMGARALNMPVVAGWHYHRSQGLLGKFVIIGPYTSSIGLAGPPMIMVQAQPTGIPASKDFIATKRDFVARSKTLKATGTRLTEAGQRKVAGQSCPYVITTTKKGNKTYALLLEVPGLYAGISLIALSSASYDAAWPKFEAWLDGLAVR